MTTIPAAICRLYHNNFESHYLKKKDFFWYFIAFLKCAQNLEHFQKEGEYPSPMISEIIDAERRGYLNV